MWFEQLIRRETGCASYMIGSTKTGECAVFDPLWDVTTTGGMSAWQAAKLPVLECSDDEACPLWRRQSEVEDAHMPTPVAAKATSLHDTGLPYWMEMGALAYAN